jgi:hypothetical protein
MVPESRQATEQNSAKPTIAKAASFSSSKTSLAKNTSGNTLPVQDDMSGQNTETLEESLALLAEAPIPDWNSEEDSGGVLAGLKCKLKIMLVEIYQSSEESLPIPPFHRKIISQQLTGNHEKQPLKI